MEPEAVASGPVCGSAVPVVSLIELALLICRAALGRNAFGAPEVALSPGDCPNPDVAGGNNASTRPNSAMLSVRRTLQNVLPGRVFTSPPASKRTPPLWNFRKDLKTQLSFRCVDRLSKRNVFGNLS